MAIEEEETWEFHLHITANRCFEQKLSFIYNA